MPYNPCKLCDNPADGAVPGMCKEHSRLPSGEEGDDSE